MWLLFRLGMWPPQSALGASALILVTGLVLTELALSNWTKVPFASAHEPETEHLKADAAWYTTRLLMYQLILSELQVRSLQSWRTTMTHLAVGAVLVIAIR